MGAFVEREVPGWADEGDVKVAALFKAFSGQREDWQGRLDFWASLIVKLARHRNLIVIDGRQVQQEWFLRDGLLPLCLNDVLLEMLRSGELQAMEEQEPEQKGLLRLGRAVLDFWTWLLGLEAEKINTVVDGKLIVSVLLKERVSYITTVLADTNWKSDCLVTMKSFVELCGDMDDSKAVMDYLVRNKRARHIRIDTREKDELIEGLKISLVQSPVSPSSSLDYHMLQLFWTSEKMKQRSDALDLQVLQLREAAIAAKDKRAALRHLRSMKALSKSRDKCGDMLAKIHEILDAISDAEATKKVSEAIQLGNLAMREQHVTLEEVHDQLKEMDEAMVLAEMVGDALGGPASDIDEENEDLLQELASLEAQQDHDHEQTPQEKQSIPIPEKQPISKSNDPGESSNLKVAAS